MADILFEPLRFRNLTVKNRILRSNISGRFDNYDGSGTQTRINWEVKFARGGVGAIISSFVPVHPRGRIIPNYATIYDDDSIPFWKALGKAVHEHDCQFIMQLSHGGRQRDVPDLAYPKGQSSTDKEDPLHGFECDRMTIADIKEVVAAFAEGARRARDAGLDGVELHGANGYLITQFLSSAINDRKDEYGGPLENRARFVLDIVQGHSRPRRARLSPADENQRDGAQQLAVRAEARGARKHRRGVGAGVQVARRGRGGRHPRVDRQRVSAPQESGGRRSRRRSAVPHLRAARVERHEHVQEPAAVPQRSDGGALPKAVGGRRRAEG